MNQTNSTDYKAFTLSNFRQIPQLEQLSDELKFDIEVVGNVLPFKGPAQTSLQGIERKNDPDGSKKGKFHISGRRISKRGLSAKKRKGEDLSNR